MADPTPPEDPAAEPADGVNDRSAGAAPRLKDKAWAKIKRGLTKIWSTGGGGFYGLGYLITFIWYEIRLLGQEFAGADGLADFLTEQLVERIFRIAIDSLGNSIKAFLWPVQVMSDYELWGMAGLAIGWVVYTYFLHQRIVDYVGIDPAAEKKAKRAAKQAAKQARLANKGKPGPS